MGEIDQPSSFRAEISDRGTARAEETFRTGPGDVLPETGLSRDGREQCATARRRLWRPRRRLLIPAAAGAVTAGVTAALLAASASHPPTALAALTSALARTSAESYSFSLNSAMEYKGREFDSDIVSGAYDPKRGLGTELLATRVAQRLVTAQIRFVGTYLYMRVSGFKTIVTPWDKAPVPPAGADEKPGSDAFYGFVTDQPVSPDELSAVLRSAGLVRDQGSASGPGWTGTEYAFTARFDGGRESVNGTVDVDQQGQVRREVAITTQGKVTTDRHLTFGDFGAPVSAPAPPASQVEYTKTPYSGFYF